MLAMYPYGEGFLRTFKKWCAGCTERQARCWNAKV